MAIKMLSPQAAAEKWKQVTPGRQNFYQQGVQAAASRYDEGVRGAEDRYAAGVSAAIANNQWQQGVEGKGSRYSARAATVGAPRWADGVSRAQSDYSAGVTPYFQMLSGMTLPPKGPKGHPGNYARSQAVGDALHAAKVRS